VKHKTILPTLCAELSSAATLRHRALEWLALRQSAEPSIRKWVDASRDAIVVFTHPSVTSGVDLPSETLHGSMVPRHKRLS
jgi:hypothetical protein